MRDSEPTRVITVSVWEDNEGRLRMGRAGVEFRPGTGIFYWPSIVAYDEDRALFGLPTAEDCVYAGP